MKAVFGLLKKLTTALLISIIIIVAVVLVTRHGQLDYLKTLLQKNIPDKFLSVGWPVGHPQGTPQSEPEIVCTEKAALKSAKDCTLLIGDVEKHGSGFVISPGDYLVTNYHVIDHFSTGYANVYYDGRFHSLRIAGFSVDDDLAVIKLDSTLPSCSWSDSQALELAENVFAVGWPNTPYGESTITKGVFSRYTVLENQNIQMIQTDTPVNPGNSGGPLINKCGVVGINTSKTNWIDKSAPSEGIGYAISSNYAQNVISQLIQNDDGSPKIPIRIVAEQETPPETNQNQTPQPQTNNYLNPNSPVAYDYDQVLFWENQKISDEAVLNSWKKAKGSDYVNQDKLDDLLDRLTRSLEISTILWDGYTNSKITYVQVLLLKQEYLMLSKEINYLNNELNLEGSINAFKNCVESWQNLEDEYDEDFSEQIKKCNDILEVD